MKMKRRIPAEMHRIVQFVNDESGLGIRLYCREEDYENQKKLLFDAGSLNGYRISAIKMCGSRIRALYDAYSIERANEISQYPYRNLVYAPIVATAVTIPQALKATLISELEFCLKYKNVWTRQHLIDLCAILNDVKQDHPFRNFPEWILEECNRVVA